MKRWLALALTSLMCVSLASCGTSKKIPLPFEVSDVKGIVLYHYTTPEDAEQKTLRYQHELESIYNMLSGISIKQNEAESYTGTSTTIFRFTLKDDAIYDVIYQLEDITHGTVWVSGDHTPWFTSTNLESLWFASDVDSAPAAFGELPIPE